MSSFFNNYVRQVCPSEVAGLHSNKLQRTPTSVTEPSMYRSWTATVEKSATGRQTARLVKRQIFRAAYLGWGTTVHREFAFNCDG